jgi:hypothetical protein
MTSPLHLAKAALALALGTPMSINRLSDAASISYVDRRSSCLSAGSDCFMLVFPVVYDEEGWEG